MKTKPVGAVKERSHYLIPGGYQECLRENRVYIFWVNPELPFLKPTGQLAKDTVSD